MVIDICAYKSPAMMECMMLKELQQEQNNNKTFILIRKGRKHILITRSFTVLMFFLDKFCIAK